MANIWVKYYEYKGFGRINSLNIIPTITAGHQTSLNLNSIYSSTCGNCPTLAVGISCFLDTDYLIAMDFWGYCVIVFGFDMDAEGLVSWFLLVLPIFTKGFIWLMSINQGTLFEDILFQKILVLNWPTLILGYLFRNINNCAILERKLNIFVSTLECSVGLRPLSHLSY